MRARPSSAILLSIALLPGMDAPARAQQGRTFLATLRSDGSQATDHSFVQALSGNGRDVLFTCFGDGVVPGDTNGLADVFLRDLGTGTVERVSLGIGGVQPDWPCWAAGMTRDARFVLFTSSSTNLVPGDTNSGTDVFLFDRSSGLLERVSVGTGGLQPNGDSNAAAISADGRWVAFASQAQNLITPPSGVAMEHVYVRDRASGTTVLADRSTLGATGNAEAISPALSADGRFLLFQSHATNLGPALPPASAWWQCYVRDLVAGTTERVSVSDALVPADSYMLGSSLSADGRFACFSAGSTNLDAAWNAQGPKVFLRDRLLGTTRRVDLNSAGTAEAGQGSEGVISSSGRFLLFASASAGYVTRDFDAAADAFVRDLATGITTRVSVDSLGQEFSGSIPGGHEFAPVDISDDGRAVLFFAGPDGLGTGDANGHVDGYVHERWQNAPTSYCRAKLSSLGCVPEMDSSGTPSATSAAPFLVGAHALVNQQLAILHYGFAPDRRPFEGGYSCIAPPFVVLAAVSTGGSPSGLDCSGAPSVDFNARIQSGLDPRLVPGAVVAAQYFFHDPGDPQALGLTNALQFVILP